MQLSTLGRSHKGKVWMQDCKQLILDLSNALTSKSAQSQELQSQVHALQSQVDALHHQIEVHASREQELTAIISKLQRNNKDQEQNIIKAHDSLFQQNLQLKMEIDSKTAQLLKAQAFNEELEQRIRCKEREIAQLSNVAKTTKNSLVQAHSHIKFLKNEVDKMREKVSSQQRRYQQELERLRDLNSSIAQHFEFFNQQYRQALGTSDGASFYHSPLRSRKPHPQHSKTGKAHLSANALAKNTSVSYKDISTQGPHNPEMGQELLKIKQSIASQYSKFAETRQGAMMQRVNQTLSKIDNILGEMEHRIAQDSSSY